MENSLFDNILIKEKQRGSYYEIRLFEKETMEKIGFMVGSAGTTCGNLHVYADYRRKGFGTFLLKKYIEFVKTKTSHSQVKLICSKTNIIAQSLYKKLGFQFSDKDESLLLCCLNV